MAAADAIAVGVVVVGTVAAAAVVGVDVVVVSSTATAGIAAAVLAVVVVAVVATAAVVVPALGISSSVALDEEGELILDAEGNAIPVTQTLGVGNSMSVNGALSSNRFFTPFNPGGVHQGWLTPAELKLISEWLDIGAQYYNNPFVAPLD